MVRALLTELLPWHPALGVPAIDADIVWQIRLPRVVLGALVGAMLAGGGAAYQGVFRNPLADPYLLGVAAGGGLGATIVIVAGGSPELLPPAAFAGAALAVALTYVLGAGTRPAAARGSVGATASIVLAGVAVAALLTAMQTYLQQRTPRRCRRCTRWILGGLSLATWSDVLLILPYVAVAAGILLAHRRLLDVLRVGEAEAGSLGVDIARLRLTVVIAATLGTAAAVSVSGLIGFVGIIVPHTVRLTAGPSYRVVLPVSMIGGAAFLILADVAARTVQSPGRDADRGDHRAGRRAVLPLRAPFPAGQAGAGVIVFDRGRRVAVRPRPRGAGRGQPSSVRAGEWLGSSGPTGPARRRCSAPPPASSATTGTIRIDGRPPSGLRRRALARLVAYVPQQPELPPDMTRGRLRAARPDPAHRLPADRDAGGPGDLRRAAGPDGPGPDGRPARSARCPAASCSGWCWPGRWPRRPRSCCSTSRPARWTWAAGWTPWNWWTSCAANGR